MREAPGKMISALEAAEAVKLGASRINALNAQTAHDYKIFVAVQRAQPERDADSATWDAYFALLDRLERSVIDNYMKARILRRHIFMIAFPHMVHDLSATLDSAPLAGSKYQEVHDMFDEAIVNLAIISFAWAMLRAPNKPTEDDQPKPDDLEPESA